MSFLGGNQNYSKREKKITIKGKLPSKVSSLLISSHSICIMLKKIIIQYPTDAQKQFGINALTLENVIYIRTVTKEFSSKPTDGSLLTTKFFFNEFSDVNHKYKKGGTIQYLFPN